MMNSSNDEGLITDAVVFKSAMTRDFRSLQELSIVQEGITHIESGNLTLRQLQNLRKLDLSFNKITRLDNLEGLKELKELNISYNQLEGLDNLGKLSGLRVVNLSHNKIRRLDSLKNLRKLEVLSIASNLLEDLTVGGGDPLLELKELNASKNKIQVLKVPLNMFPNVRASLS
jgi:Leucine-rich repeat (LRR) protein